VPVSLQFTATEPAGITSWTLTPTPPPNLGAFVPCAGNAYDQSYLLGILNRGYPYDYIQGLQLTQNSGYEQFYAAAKVGERVSIGIANFECDSFVISANGGRQAVGALEIWKTDTSAFTLQRGSTFSTTDGRIFATTVDQAFDAMNLGPFLVPIQAVDVGYEYNTPGQVVALNGEVLPGAITRIEVLSLSPPTFDPTIQIKQLLETYGGREAALDALGADLLVTRVPGEEDPAYRLRIKETPDTVSPNAIIRGVNRLLQSVNPSWTCVLHEVGYPNFQGIFFDAGSSADSPQDPDWNFAWDMNPDDNIQDRFKTWLDAIEFRGFFLVEIPDVSIYTDFGLIYDAVDPTNQLINAWDQPENDAPNASWDGQATYSAPLYQAILDLIEAKHAAGIGYDVILTASPVPPPIPPPT